MAKKKEVITERKTPTKEGEAMDSAFKKAVRRASRRALASGDPVLTEKDGWLVYVNSKGVVTKKVRRLVVPIRRVN